MMYVTFFLSFFACNTKTTELSEELTSQIVKQVVSELESSAQEQLIAENIKELIQEEVKKTSETPKFDPVQHRKNLLSNTKSNRQFSELYVRVSGIDAYPKSNFKSRMEAAGRSKLRTHAQSKDVSVSSLNMEEMKVERATCNDKTNTCAANFRLKYQLN